MENEIINNLKSDSSYELTLREFTYVQENFSLALKLLRMFSDKKEYWENNYDLFSDILEDLLTDKKMQNLDEFYYRKYTLGEYSIIYGSSLLSEIDRVFSSNSPYKKLTLEFFYSKLEDDENLEIACFNDNLMKYLIENGKFNSLKKLGYVNEFSVTTAELFLEKYPYKKLGTPKFIYSVFDDENYSAGICEKNGYGILKVINKIGFENLDSSLLLSIFASNPHQYTDLDIKANIVSIILNRLLNKDESVTSTFKNNVNIYRSFYLFLFDNLNIYSEIVRKLIDNNNFIFAALAYRIEFSRRYDYRELLERVYENIDNEYAFMTYLIPNIHNLGLGCNHKIIDYLVEHGKLKILFDNMIANLFPKMREYIINRVIGELQGNNSNYDEDINSLTSNIIKYPKVLNAILATNRIYNFSFLEDYPRPYIKSNGFSSTISQHMQNVGDKIILPKKTNLIFMQDVYIKYGRKRELIEWLANIKILNIYGKNIDTILQILREHPEYTSIIAKSSHDVTFAFLNPDALEIALLEESYDKEELINYANHHESCDFFYTKSNCILLKKYIVNKYGIQEKNYIFMVDKLGPQILKYLKTPNIKKLLELDYEALEKIINLFLVKSYDKADLISAYDSIKQYRFTKINLRIVNCFSNIMQFLEFAPANFWEYSYIIDYIDNILYLLDNKFWSSFYERHPEFKTVSTKEELVIYILKKIKNNDNTLDYRGIFHELTDYYIMKSRERFRNNANIYTDLQMPFKYNRKSAVKYTILYLLEHDHNMFKDGAIKPFSVWLDNCFKNNGYPILTLEKFVNDALNPNAEHHYFDSNTLKKLWRLTNNLFTENWSDTSLIIKAAEKYDIKKEYIIDSSYNEKTFYDILSYLNLEIFIKTVICDNEVYNSLYNTMQKRKIHILPHFLKEYICDKKFDLAFTDDDIAAFMTNYKRIFDKEIKKSKYKPNMVLSLQNIIKYAITFGSNMEYYNLILGSNDATIIKRNSGPNAACLKLKNNERLREAVSYTISNFKRTQITVPAFNEVIEVNGKNIRAIVGNFTHPSNLTHGERTGACMRIGGVGESLFRFVLTNPNGFHIRFESENHEYISRVSGFRNGNTVFLNQLRYSLNEEVSNNDLRMVLSIVAQKIIGYSKKSSFPIENIVIDDSYVMDGLSCTYLKVEGIKTGLPNFYSDVSNCAVILATSSKKKKFAPIKLGVEKLPVYKPAREIPIYSEKLDDIIDAINRVHTLNGILNSNISEYQVEILNIEHGFRGGYVNMDWYAYIDSNGDIHSEILCIDERAKDELDSAIEILKNRRIKIK